MSNNNVDEAFMTVAQLAYKHNRETKEEALLGNTKDLEFKLNNRRL